MVSHLKLYYMVIHLKLLYSKKFKIKLIKVFSHASPRVNTLLI